MAIDLGFIEEYVNLLIIQYWEKQKAKATIEAISTPSSEVYHWFSRFDEEFDLDQATGHRLDIIGKIVGMPRSVPFVVAKELFGFEGDPTAGTMDDVLAPLGTARPFKDLFEPPYSELQLNDDRYRFFIRAKIAKNVVAAYMVSDDRISIQDVISTLFKSDAYVIDNYDMTLTLFVGLSYDPEIIRLAQQSNLLPKPQGVRYLDIIQADPLNSFGFDINPNSKGFGSKFDGAYTGGRFANKVVTSGVSYAEYF